MKITSFKSTSALAALYLAGASSASAALSLTIANPNFEDSIPTGNVYNATVPGWSEYGDYASGIGLWDNTGGGLTAFLPITDLGAASLIVRDTAGPDQWMFQSLGTVGVADVGQTFSLGVDFGGRQDYADNRTANVDMTVAFRSGTTTGTLGTVHGSASTRNIVTVVSTAIIPFETHTATFTPTAGDVGTEIFAVLDIHRNSAGGANGERQFTADNVTLGVGEPLSLKIFQSGPNLAFEWDSVVGMQYDLLSSTDLATDPATWAPYDDGVTTHQDIPASGTGTNTLGGVIPLGPRRFFVLCGE